MTTLPLPAPTHHAAPSIRTAARLRTRIPARVRSTVTRPRLLDALDRAAGSSRVTVLTAPAGSGKTTLLVDWIHSRHHAEAGPVAWLTVEESDNVLADMYDCVIAVFARCGSIEVATAMSALPKIDEPSYADVGTLLVEALESVGHPITLILDDIHLLHDRDVLTVLGNFLRWPPRNVRTIVAGRYEPPLGLQKLRLDGAAQDIWPSTLDFTSDEAAELCTRFGSALDADDLAKLMVRTEGWAAGLRLARTAMAGNERPSLVIDRFSGSQQAVADYLVEEILSGLPGDVRRFLVETSVPRQFTAPLAERLTGDPGAQNYIDILVHRNCLIERIPGEEPSYRYHPLLRQYLRDEITRLGTAQIRNLERVAASWFHDSRQPLQSLEHSVHAQDGPAIVDILLESGLGMVLRGDSTAVLAAIERSPASVGRGAVAQLICAAAHLLDGSPALASSILSALRRSTTGGAVTGSNDTELLRRILELHASLRSGHVRAALDRVGVDVGKSGSRDLDAYALMTVGLAELHLGDNRSALASLSDAIANARAGDLHLIALTCMSAEAGAHLLAAHLDEALRKSLKSQEYARRHGLTDSPVYALAQSVELVVAALRLAPASVAHPDEVWAAVARATDPASADHGRHAGWVLNAIEVPHERHDRLSATFDRPAVPAFEALLVPSMQQRHLACGDMQRATALVDATARRLGRVGEVSLLSAEMHMRRGRLDAADVELAAVLGRARRCCTPVTEIRASLTAARVATARKRPVRAFESVVRALRAAEPESILLPFVEAGADVREILARNHGRFGVLEPFAAAARSAIPPADSATGRSGGALTPRELELLRELPSWRTAEQIAADHFVSVNTIKTHLRGIYRKLEVKSRRDAITAAHDLGLL